MQITQGYSYVGGELELFMKAVNWKNYWASSVRPFVHGKVLDVGAGIGATFDYLHEASESWTCLEPDPAMCEQIERRTAQGPRPPRVLCGTLAHVPAGESFDCIVYVDVLEHIEDHEAELAAAAQRLGPGGTLIVLSPAFQFLFSPFDAAVGHFRRYTRQSLAAIAPESLSVQSWFYLDGVGVMASMFARLARRAAPSSAQIEVWDNTIVPVSRVTDMITRRLFGRTIIMVWKKL